MAQKAKQTANKKKKKQSRWGMPKNAAAYFAPHHNDAFMKKHPVLTVLIGLADIIIVLVPMIGYATIASHLAPAPNHPWLLVLIFIPGLISSGAVALGIANIWMAVLHQYLGHRFTLITLLGGSAVCALTLWLMTLV